MIYKDLINSRCHAVVLYEKKSTIINMDSISITYITALKEVRDEFKLPVYMSGCGNTTPEVKGECCNFHLVIKLE